MFTPVAIGVPKFGAPLVPQLNFWIRGLRVSLQPWPLKELAWKSIQFSLPAGEVKNEQWPGPNVLPDTFFVKTGCEDLVQSLGLSGSPSGFKVNMPRQ